MRKFSLMNSLGETWNLTTLEILFHDPQGLGYSVEASTIQVGNRWIITNVKPNQNDITGKLWLYSDKVSPYTVYQRFINFISYYPLTLLYTPVSTTYRRSVIVSSLNKGELNHLGAFDDSITFKPLSMWYTTETAEYITEKPTIDKTSWFWRENDGAITWGTKFGNQNIVKNYITSDSVMDGNTKLYIYGPATNPKWTQVVNGSVVDSGQVMTIVDEGSTLIIDNTTFPNRIYILDKNGHETDVYQNSNFALSQFPTIRHGENRFTITNDTAGLVQSYKIEAQILYNSV